MIAILGGVAFGVATSLAIIVRCPYIAGGRLLLIAANVAYAVETGTTTGGVTGYIYNKLDN